MIVEDSESRGNERAGEGVVTGNDLDRTKELLEAAQMQDKLDDERGKSRKRRD